MSKIRPQRYDVFWIDEYLGYTTASSVIITMKPQCRQILSEPIIYAKTKPSNARAIISARKGIILYTETKQGKRQHEEKNY